MIEYFRDLRLIPIAVVASTCLLALVAADLLLGRVASLSDGDSSRFNEVTVIHAAPGAVVDSKRSWAQQMFNFPDPKAPPRQRDDMSFLPVIPPLPADTNNADITTGSVPEPDSEKGEKPKGEGGQPTRKRLPTSHPATSKQPARKDPPRSRRIRRRRPTAPSFPLMPRPMQVRRRPNGRSSNAYRSGGRSWKSARLNSTFAKA